MTIKIKNVLLKSIMKRIRSNETNKEIQETTQEPDSKRICLGLETNNRVSSTVQFYNSFYKFISVCLHKDLYSFTIEKSSLPDLLTLRQVSVQDCQYITPLLSHCAQIHFQYRSLLDLDSELKEKFDFALKNTQVTVHIFGRELLSLIPQTSNILSIPEKKLNINLEIRELNSFSELLKNISKNELISKIHKIYFNIEININNIDELNEIFKIFSANPNFAAQISELCFGNIDSHTNFILPECFTQLKTLIFGKIKGNVTLPSLPNLESLAFDKLCFGCNLTLPESLNNLEILYLGNINIEKHLEIATSFDRLKQIIIKDVKNSSTIVFINELPNLEVFYAENIDQYAAIKILYPLLNLKQFIIGDRFNHFNSNDYSFPALETLSFKNIATGVYINLENLQNLQSVSLGDICENAQVTIKKCPQLQILAIKEIQANAFLQVNNSCNNIKRLSIKSIDDEATLILKNSCINLEELTIEKVEENYKDKLPISLPQLKRASFEIIPQTFRLAKQFYNIQELNIGTIEAKTRIILPPSFTQLSKLFIGDILLPSDNINIKFIRYNSNNISKIPKISLAANDIPIAVPYTFEKNNIFISVPDTFEKLDIFSIGTIRDNITINLLYLIQNLHINEIKDNVTVQIPEKWRGNIQNIKKGNNVSIEYKL